MSDGNEYARRHLLRFGVMSAVGYSGIGSVSAIDDVTEGVETPGAVDDATQEVNAPEAVAESAEQIPLLEVEDRTETKPLSGLPEPAMTIRPGSQLFVHNSVEDTTGGCTANFIWRSPDGTAYLGTAGHCFLPEGEANQDAARDHENGYDVDQLSVRVCADCNVGGKTGLTVEGDVVELGDVVYARDTNPDPRSGLGVGHDFGLVEIPDEAIERGLVDPSVPQYGGPRSVSEEAISAGQTVSKYGAGVGGGETFVTMGSNGSSFGDLDTEGAWFAGMRATPGDSGAPLQSTRVGGGLEGDEAGGVLTHLTLNGVAGTAIGRSRELVASDIGLDIAPVLAGEL